MAKRIAICGALLLSILLFSQCRLPIPISDPPEGKEAEPVAVEANKDSNSDNESGTYPRLVVNSSDESHRPMYEPGESRTITLENGTTVIARTGSDYLELTCKLPQGGQKSFRQKDGPEMNHSVFPMGPYVLIVSGVNAGPSGAGVLLDPHNGNRHELKVTFDYGDSPELYQMSLYAMSLIEYSPGIFLVAGTGNQAMLKVNVNTNPPKSTELKFPEIPVDAEFRSSIENGKIYYRYREIYGAWKVWPLPEMSD